GFSPYGARSAPTLCSPSIRLHLITASSRLFARATSLLLQPTQMENAWTRLIVSSLLLDLGLNLRDVSVHLCLVLQVKREHFVDQGQRQSGVFLVNHLGGETIAIRPDDQVKVDAMAGQTDFTHQATGQEVRQVHGVPP